MQHQTPTMERWKGLFWLTVWKFQCSVNQLKCRNGMAEGSATVAAEGSCVLGGAHTAGREERILGRRHTCPGHTPTICFQPGPASQQPLSMKSSVNKCTHNSNIPVIQSCSKPKKPFGDTSHINQSTYVPLTYAVVLN